jgi:hypothetical protein
MALYRDKPRTRDERVGDAFKLNDTYERLLAMSDERRDQALKDSPGVRMAFGFYLSAKSAALRLEKEATQ